MTVCGIKHADGVCVMGKCPHIKKCCPVVWDKSGEPMTNEKWFCGLSTEEKANFLNQIVRVGPYENEPKDFWKYVYGGGGDRGEKSIVAWLEQPHSEVAE